MNHLPCPERTPSPRGRKGVYIKKKKKKKNPTRIPNYTHKLTDYKFLQDFIVFFFFLVGLGFELRFAKQGLYCLNYTSSPFCYGYLGDSCLLNYLPRLASNCDPPNVSLPSS
jgi:hypothetical protein